MADLTAAEAGGALAAVVEEKIVAPREDVARALLAYHHGRKAPTAVVVARP